MADDTRLTLQLSLTEDMGRPGYIDIAVESTGPIAVETWRTIYYQFEVDVINHGVEVVDGVPDGAREEIQTVLRERRRAAHEEDTEVVVPEEIPFAVDAERRAAIREELAAYYDSYHGLESYDSTVGLEFEIEERSDGPVVVDVDVSVTGYVTRRTARLLERYGVDPEEYGVEVSGA